MFNLFLRIVFILFFSNISLSLLAQNKIEILTDSVNAYIATNPEKTTDFVKEIQLEYKALKDWGNYCFGYYDIAASYMYTEDYDNAIVFFNKGIKTAEQYNLPLNADVYSYFWNGLGSTYYNKGDFKKATQYFESSLKVDTSNATVDKKNIPYKYYNIACVYDEDGDYEQALSFYNKALSTVEPSDFIFIINLYTGIGYAYFNLNDNQASENYYKKALELYQNNSSTDPVFIKKGNTLLLNYIELCIQENKTTYALEQLLPLIKETQQTERTKAAVKQMTALAIQRQSPNSLKVNQYLYEALGIRTEILGTKHHIVAKTHRLLAENQILNKNFTKALKHYQNACKALVIGFEENDVKVNPPLENYVKAIELLKNIIGKAETWKKLKKYHEALECYLLASALMDEIRLSHQNNASKLFLIAEGKKIYENAIHTAFLLNDFEQAFFFSEKSRSMLLLEKMRGIQARIDIPEQLLKQEQDLKIDIAFYERKIWEENKKKEPSHLLIKQWQSFIFDLKASKRTLIEKYEVEYPEYFKLQYSTTIATIEDIRAKILKKDKALVSYFIGQKHSFIFSIDQENIFVDTLELEENSNDKINLFRACLQRKEQFENNHALCYELANQLFLKYVNPATEHFNKAVNKLILLPDGHLNYIPFETLLTDVVSFDEARYELRKLPYLIKKYQISYGYSSTILIEERLYSKIKGLEEFGGFVPNFQNNTSFQRGCSGEVLGNLPFGRENIGKIREIMDGSLLFDADASIENFKEMASKYKILHLCTHACAETDLKDTRIYFTDKELLAFELYNMPINAQMAVLSACETGIGEIKEGEGVMSLARAFSYSGCPSVVTSLWSIDDKSTSEIMRYFYINIKAGYEKDEALHLSKLKYLEGKGIESSHPYFWSAFVHIGNTQALYDTKSDFPYEWMVLIGIIAIALWVWRRKS